MLFQQIVNGLISGCIIALVALGYTMVYGVMRLINFAHASIFMAGSMFAWFILKTSNIIGERSFESASIQLDETQKILVWIIISVGAALFAATLGVTIERIAYRPLRKASRLSIVISAMAAGMVIDNVAMVLSGGSVKGFPNLIPEIQFNVAGAYITGIQIFIVMLTIIILAALWLLVYRTYFGCAIRALSEDYEAAALMGVNVNNVIITIKVFENKVSLPIKQNGVYLEENAIKLFEIGSSIPNIYGFNSSMNQSDSTSTIELIYEVFNSAGYCPINNTAGEQFKIERE